MRNTSIFFFAGVAAGFFFPASILGTAVAQDPTEQTPDEGSLPETNPPTPATCPPCPPCDKSRGEEAEIKKALDAIEAVERLEQEQLQR